MALARDIAHLGGDFDKRLKVLERELDGALKLTRKRAGEAGREAQLEEIAEDAGGDKRLSRVRSGKGANVGAKFRITAAQEVLIQGTGPLPLLANPMPPHEITGKRGKTLLLPGPTFQRAVHHPGTPGKDTWNRGVDKAQPKIARVIGADVDKAVRRGFEKGRSV